MLFTLVFCVVCVHSSFLWSVLLTLVFCVVHLVFCVVCVVHSSFLCSVMNIIVYNFTFDLVFSVLRSTAFEYPPLVFSNFSSSTKALL